MYNTLSLNPLQTGAVKKTSLNFLLLYFSRSLHSFTSQTVHISKEPSANNYVVSNLSLIPMKPASIQPIVATKKNNWPQAWLMPEDVTDLKAMNRMCPNVAIPVKALCDLGISYCKVGIDAFSSPVQSVSWNQGEHPMVRSCRDHSDYSYANIITLHSDHFPEDRQDYNQAIAYLLVGSGFLDVCASSDDHERWVRIHVKKGDLITLPEELYHRFVADQDICEHKVDHDQAVEVRYFAGQPCWTPLVRIFIEKNEKDPASRRSSNNEGRCTQSNSTAQLA